MVTREHAKFIILYFSILLQARRTTPNKELHNKTALRVILIHFSSKLRSLCFHCCHDPNYFLSVKQWGNKFALTQTHARLSKINNFTEVFSPGESS
jgi:hypothetical protein